MSSFFGLSKTRTFKPKRNIPEGSKQYQLKRYAEATLGSGNLRLAVILPEGEDLNEWLAVNTVDFFNHVNMLYGTVTEFCTPSEVSSQSVLSMITLLTSHTAVPRDVCGTSVRVSLAGCQLSHVSTPDKDASTRLCRLPHELGPVTAG